MSVVYGYDAAPTNDPYVEYAEQGMKAISKATDSKRAALLGVFPFRRFCRMNYSLTEFRSSLETTYLDAWLVQSGSGSRKALCDWFSQSPFWDGIRSNGAPTVISHSSSLLTLVKASGTGTPSMISDAVRRNEINGNLPEVTLAIRNTSAVAYGGKYACRIYYPIFAHILMQPHRKP